MSWTLTFERSPQGSNSMGNVDDEIRALKSEIKTILGREHYFDVPAVGGADATKQLAMQGRHRPGNAKVLASGTWAALPVVNADGSAFTEADDGKLVWAYQVGRGMSLYLGYWKNDTMNWWPVYDGQIGEVRAITDQGFLDDPAYPMDIGKNTMPGWFACDGRSLALTYNFGTGREFVITRTLPDLRGKVLRGAAIGSWGTGGADTATLNASNMPQHNHTLPDSAKPTVTVADHPATKIEDIKNAGLNGGSNLFKPTTDAGNFGELKTPVLSHTVTVGWPAGAATDNAGQASPTAFSIVPSHKQVTYVMRVI